MFKSSVALLVATIVAQFVFNTAMAADKIPENAHLAIVGDSITQQIKYSVYMEAYLLMCAGRKDITVAQYGWSGERADGFARRAENDLELFKPNVVTLCYGMNDGGYRVYDEKIGGAYEKNMRDVLAKLKKLGVAEVVVGSPGAVDTKYFNRNIPNKEGKSGAEIYNDNLKHLRDIDEKLATENKLTFADLHTAMIEAMANAKKDKGDDYDVCGRDGVHPNSNGHLIMAYSLLKALGCDGNIGEITIDMKGQATATDGHKILSADKGKVEIESTKYPFCFDTDPKNSGSNRSILPYLPFNQDLNRLILKVKNLDAPKAKVTWGKETLEFSKDQLEKGLNLAAEFAKTPFDANFRKVMGEISKKQQYESRYIKGMVSQFRSLGSDVKDDAEFEQLCNKLKAKIFEIQAKKSDAEKQLITPVKYELTITPVG